MKSTHTFIAIALATISFTSCKPQKEEGNKTPEKTVVEEVNLYDTNNPKGMLMEVSKSLGGFDKLKELNDVSFTYNYVSPDGKKDISVEKYIFQDEISWAKYTAHEINVAPGVKGDVVQFYNGKSAYAHIDGEKNTDPQNVGTSQFLRQANYMWFTMMHKLTDPGTIHKYVGQEEVDGTTYDKIHITYDTAITGKEVNDIYIVYINPKNKMIEQFKFSLPAFKVLEPVLLAKCYYTEIDGVKVINKREMFAPTTEGTYNPMVSQTLENIKFNNGYTKESLQKML